MSDTTFVDYVTPIPATWLNDVNDATYTAIGTGTVAPTTAADVRTNLGLSGVGGAALIGATASGTLSGATVEAQLVELDTEKATLAQADYAANVVAATTKTTPVDADLIGISDSAAAGVIKSLSWANLKATLLSTWKDTTGGLVGMTLFKINFKNAANTFTSFFTNSNTAARTYTFQDRDGTIADTTDIAGLSTTTTKLPTITATVAANALTIDMAATYLDFRSATLGSGTISTLLADPTALVVSSGSTLGTANATISKLAVLAINNAGTVELAVVNMAGGFDLSETGLVTTTAEGGAGGADSAAIAYSTTARTSVPYRVVGYIESTQATAGTWATAPSTIQGAGGSALSGLGSLSVSASGYTKLSNGLVLQWGVLTTTAGADTTVTYPIAFPRTVLHVSATADYNYTSEGIVQLQGTPGVSTFAVVVNNAGSRVAAPIYWFAMGI